MIVRLSNQMATLRQDSLLNQQSIARLERSADRNPNGPTLQRPGHASSEDELAIRRELVEDDRKRHPAPTNPRRSIRLIKETFRLSGMKFEGNVVKCNPRRFIRDFQENATLEGLNEREKLTLFKSLMKGEAMAWVESVESESFTNIRREFLNKYWNQTIQRKIVHQILDGKYSDEVESSLETYFRKWSSLARSLDQQRDDEWIIENLKYHFNEKIQEKFELREPRTITEAADILMKFDKADYGITSRRKFNKGSNFSRNTTQFGDQRSNETGTKKQSFNY